ncbi:9637_t:CDS:2 [Funneliformis caledonium]|uniref:9637_t:CDS:1 n=1 Tax=Funneliformis caledonium TaxID=1117310 RepID=A0A9N9HL53_9GLOM|nr:9637_t:CDS:2 [Funneliformis caledonium]
MANRQTICRFHTSTFIAKYRTYSYGEFDSEIILKVEKIENWISRYSAACKREMAAIALERQEQN